MSYWIVDGRNLTNAEYEELRKQKKLEKQRAQEEASRLSRQLGEAYAALKEHLQRNPDEEWPIPDERALDQQIYQNLRRNLEQANQAPRCSAIKQDGTRCGSPKMKTHIYCFTHYRMIEARAENLTLPPMEDANAIQMAVMLVQRALIDDEISEKKAGLLLYSIQIAATNVDKTTFGQAADEEMVTEFSPEDEVIRQHDERTGKHKKMEEIQRGKTLPLMNTDNTYLNKSEEQSLPRMNADERGSETGVGKMLPQPVGGGGVLEGFAG